ncbi:MAG: hypothetical protein RL131_770 [Bacteroidota bacterium]
MKFATIITIGDELLIGQTIDTNSAWIASTLNSIGIAIKRRIAVSDQWDDIWSALDEESKNADLILITGGLGPTSDDITKPLLARYFNGELIVNQEALDNVVDIFTNKLKRPLLERNLKQAEVPSTCTVIPNKRGTAPGMWFEKEGKIFVSMPGVPHEMKGMMEGYVIPEIQKHFKLNPVLHRTLLTAGIGESFLAELLVPFETNLPSSIKIAYLPNYGMVRIRLTNSDGLEKNILEEQFEKLKALVKDFLVVDRDISLQEHVGEQLIAHHKTLAIAESCTGGYISHLITSIPGSSQFYLGGITSYSNEVKELVLDVPKETLMRLGAVSEEVACKMAEGARHKTGADYAIATTGIMGPGGGTADKPVGLVCVGFSSKEKTTSTVFHFRFDRKRNIELTAIHALDFLRKNMG